MAMADDLEHGSSAAESTGPETELRGIDLARRALEEARAAAKASGKAVGQGRASPRKGGVRALRRRGWSGAGPDERDPQLLSAVAGALAKGRGWSGKVAEGTVFGRWSSVVGEDIASHATPVSLTDGVLSIQAESTAWATQLRMLQAQLLAKINAAVGQGVVKQLKISGPAAPSWRKGTRHVKGLGPRDTYG
ncbi:putative nucleic acid-binding Zn ribbon protein [Nocardia sp. GAS34]